MSTEVTNHDHLVATPTRAGFLSTADKVRLDALVGGGGGSWGSITGTLSDQTDLQSALNAKADLASPALTGTPTAPTAAPGTNTTQVATTAFVRAAVVAVSYIDGEVQYHADLPVTLGTPAIDSAYLVRQSSGLWLINRKPAGIWVRLANTGALSDWTYAGEFADVYSDANFALYDNADSTKEVGFQLSGITTGTKRILTVPDKDGTLAMLSDLSGGGGEKWQFTFDGQGQVISTTDELFLPVMATGTITKISLAANLSGDATVTVKRYTPSAGARGAAVSTLGTASLTSDTSLATTGLSWAVTAGDEVGISVASVTVITRLSGALGT